jgi:ubiquinone/menaquinone biosynthesis C-methylase UbiE
MLTNQYVNGRYLEKVKDWHEGDAVWKAANVLQMIKNNRLSPHSICDVGCGTGGVVIELLRLMDESVQFTGFDISPQAISLARQKHNSRIRFIPGDFLSVPEAGADLTLLLDVIEHVPDYIGFLDRIREKTGWIIFHIPLDINVKGVIRKSHWMLYMRQRYGHLHYFSRETAIATLSDVGFEIIDSFYTDDMEISRSTRPGQLRQRIIYYLRKLLYRQKPHWAAALFHSFNLMILACGDLKSNTVNESGGPS